VRGTGFLDLPLRWWRHAAGPIPGADCNRVLNPWPRAAKSLLNLIEAFEIVAPGVKRCTFEVPGHAHDFRAQLIASLWALSKADRSLRIAGRNPRYTSLSSARDCGSSVSSRPMERTAYATAWGSTVESSRDGARRKLGVNRGTPPCLTRT